MLSHSLFHFSFHHPSVSRWEVDQISIISMSFFLFPLLIWSLFLQWPKQSSLCTCLHAYCDTDGRVRWFRGRGKGNKVTYLTKYVMSIYMTVHVISPLPSPLTCPLPITTLREELEEIRRREGREGGRERGKDDTPLPSPLSPLPLPPPPPLSTSLFSSHCRCR